MSSTSSSKRSGQRTTWKLTFGRTHVVRPRGIHQATIVWLHGHGENGSMRNHRRRFIEGDLLFLSNFLKALLFQISSGSAQLPLLVHLLHMAVILALLSCEGFDAEEFSEDALDDLEELDASAVHVANLLSTEPADIKLGIGGFSMGGATALYCAMCHCLRHCVNGYLYQIKIHCIVALSGWLPCSRMLRSCIERSSEAMKRASSLPTMICHGTGDDQVAYTLGEKSAQTIKASGFQNLVFRTYEELGHYHSPEEVHELCCWLNATLELDGSYN